jgi:hypothetical protein
MRKPVRDITGRQYGETVRDAEVRYLSGEKLSAVEYEAPSNEAAFSAFARDIEKGKYAGRIIYTIHTALATDEESTVLWVYFSELGDDPYTWGQQ